MTDQTIEIPRRQFFLLRWLKSFLLLRESGVGMVGAALVIFWVLVAILAPLIAPFDPNATLSPIASARWRGASQRSTQYFSG